MIQKRIKLGLISILCLISGITSCNKKDNFVENNSAKHWDRLIIDSKNQRIVIDEGFDCGIRCYWDIEEVNNDNTHIKYNPINYKEEKFTLNKMEQDSLFGCINEIITNPVYTDQFATDYAGKISVSITTGTITRSCSYSFVENWTTISPQLNELYLMLKRKTEIPKE